MRHTIFRVALVTSILILPCVGHALSLGYTARQVTEHDWQLELHTEGPVISGQIGIVGATEWKPEGIPGWIWGTISTPAAGLIGDNGYLDTPISSACSAVWAECVERIWDGRWRNGSSGDWASLNQRGVAANSTYLQYVNHPGWSGILGTFTATSDIELTFDGVDPLFGDGTHLVAIDGGSFAHPGSWLRVPVESFWLEVIPLSSTVTSPEPATAISLTAGLLGLFWMRIKRKPDS